ncbi:hypothetical protein TNCV_4082591 [Trichonephila clavipes]|nr:hypothetical protein TNCV_4082591 [Trichonephila clavipes]
MKGSRQYFTKYYSEVAPVTEWLWSRTCAHHCRVVDSNPGALNTRRVKKLLHVKPAIAYNPHVGEHKCRPRHYGVAQNYHIHHN